MVRYRRDNNVRRDSSQRVWVRVGDGREKGTTQWSQAWLLGEAEEGKKNENAATYPRDSVGLAWSGSIILPTNGKIDRDSALGRSLT